MILTFVNTKVMIKTRELAKIKYDEDGLKEIRFCLVHKFAETLKGIEE